MSDAFEHLVGRICLERGWLTQQQLIQCLKDCGSTVSDLPATRLSDVIVGKGYVKPGQMDSIRKEVDTHFARSSEYQLIRKDDVLLGQLLIQRKSATPEAIKKALSEQELESKRGTTVPRLGEILVRMGATSFAAIEEVLVLQQGKITLTCPTCKATYAVSPYDPKKKYLCKKCSGVLVKPEDAASMAKTVTSVEPEEVEKAKTNPKNVFGKYVVVKELGRGGMGAVYKAWDGGLRRWVALKLLTAQGEGDELARFQREAQTAASLKHQNIVGIYEVGSHDDKHFIAMEFIEGHTLAGHRMPARKAIEVMHEVAAAVEYAHSKNIIHRDIKPHNIMLDGSGKSYVMDFGLAKSLKGESQITVSGTVVGTPSYMSPEQAQGKLHLVDKKSDIYSLGAVLYEMLTGRPPFKGGTPIDTLHQVVNKDPVPLREMVKTIPEDIETIVLKCLEKDKARRYPSARLLADDLDRWLQGEAIAARPVSMATKVSKRFSKNRAPVIAGIAVGVALLVTVVVLMQSSSGKQEEFEKRVAAGDKAYEKKDWKGALQAYENAKTLDMTPALREKIEECRTKIKREEEVAKAAEDEEERKKREEIDKERKKSEELEKEKKRREEARAKAQPEYDAGQRKIDEARLDLYRPGADLSTMNRRLEDAIGCFHRAIELNKEFHEAYLGRGIAKAMLYRPDEAEKDFAEAIRLFPTFAAAYFERGKLHLARFMELVVASEWRKAESQRDYVRVWRDRAVEDFKSAQKLGGLGEDAEFIKANLAYAEDRHDEVIAILTRLINSGSKREVYFKLRADAYGVLARQNRDDKYFQNAIDDYTQALGLCANYYEARRYRGALYYERGMPEEAFEDFSTGLKLNPNDSYALSDMGTYHQKSGKDDTAMEYYDKAISINPRNFRAWTNRGTVKLGRGNYVAAIADFEEALKYHPYSLSARFNKAIALFYLKDETKAIQLMDEVLKENPNFAHGFWTRSQVHYGRQRWRLALSDLEECVRLDPRYEEKARPFIDDCRKRLGN